MEDIARGVALREAAKPKSKTLVSDAIDLLREEVRSLEKERDALRLKALAHDKKVAELSRTARSATEDSEALLEVVSLFAQVITNGNREWRKVREKARKLLEDRGIPPPSTLGSSRNRKKAGSRAPRTPEST